MPVQHRHRLLELELVEVAGDDDLGVRIARQQAVDEVVDRLRLRGALHLAGVERRLVGAVQRAAAALGGEVVVDDRDLFAVELEGRDQRRTRIEERIVGIGLLVGIAGRIGDGRAVGRHRLQRPVDEVDAVGAVEEGGADVAAALAAIGVVADERIVDEGIFDAVRRRRIERIDQHLQGLARRRDRRGRGIARPVIVLHLLQGDDVGQLQLVDDLLRDRGEARRAVVRVEILGVVARHRQPVRACPPGVVVSFTSVLCLLDAYRPGRHDLVVAEVVAHDAGDVAKLRADRDARARRAGEDAIVVVDLDALGIEVAAG